MGKVDIKFNVLVAMSSTSVEGNARMPENVHDMIFREPNLDVKLICKKLKQAIRLPKSVVIHQPLSKSRMIWF